MRKRSATLLATAALIGAALPLMGAGSASAAGFKCQPTSHDYVVVKEKAAGSASAAAVSTRTPSRGAGSTAGT
jgi:hypothetical protein